MVSTAEYCKEKLVILLKEMFFSLIDNYLGHSNNSRQLSFNINACCFDSVILLRFTKMVKCLPEFEYFYSILEK